MQLDATLAVGGLRCVAGVQRVRGSSDASYNAWSEVADAGATELPFAELLAMRTLTGDLDAAGVAVRDQLRALAERKNHPVAVLFSTRRDIPAAVRTLPTLEPQDVGSAYTLALQSREIALRDVMYWFRVQESKYGTAAGARVLERLREVVHAFAPDFTSLRVEDGTPPRFVVTKRRTKLDLRQLSDGERSLLALIFDLTRRLTVANPADRDPIRNGRAVVLIDELEHHLHPSWQRRVLGMLTDTFKGCQFIATTHAPLIVGTTAPSSVRAFSRDGDRVVVETPQQAYGLDPEAVLTQVMDTPEVRPEPVLRAIREANAALTEGDLTTAVMRAKDLRRLQHGATPDVIDIETTVANIEALAGDANNHEE